MSAIHLPLPARMEHASPEPKETIQDSLSGKNAFYNQPDYLQATKRDFAQHEALPTTYTWNTEWKITTLAKRVFSAVFFPLGMFESLHDFAGKKVVPASNPTLMGYPKNHANESREAIPLRNKWIYRRITVEVDGCKIDAAIVGTRSSLGNGRWVLSSNGNGEFYEDKLGLCSDFKELLTALNGNGIVFNYPGVGSSSGSPNRQAMAKAYRAMLSFLEDQENGIGAKEIIGYGHSIGGGVQGDALETHELKPGIKYVFVKSRTFSDLSAIVSNLTCRLLGLLVKCLGWNMGSLNSSPKLQVPEIILQTAKVQTYEELDNSAKVIDDGVITADASLAKALLDDKACPKKDKLFLGIPERHNDRLEDPLFLAEKIEAFLQMQ